MNLRNAQREERLHPQSMFLYPNVVNKFSGGEVTIYSATKDSFVAEVAYGHVREKREYGYLVWDIIQIEEDFWQVIQIFETVSTGLKKIRQGDKKPIAEIRRVNASEGQDWMFEGGDE